jgi:L-threonylcarbamoyladenylate synthase
VTTRVVVVDPREPAADALADAVAVLHRGGLVAFPTETVYGLGSNALDAAAVERIFRAKGRPPTDPMIVHLADVLSLQHVADQIPDSVTDLARAFWPGPLTLILRKQPSVPDVVSAGLATIGVRVPSHPVAHRLLQDARMPLAAPSANRFSRPSPTTAAHVLNDLDGAIDLILDGGPADIGVESTILDLTVSPPLVRRPGGVPLEDIRRLLPDAESLSAALDRAQPQPAPGQMVRHYAPRAPLTLYVGSIQRVSQRVASDARRAASAGSHVGILAPAEDLVALAPRLAAAAAVGRIVTRRYGSRKRPEEAARDLFAALRALDEEPVDLILATAAPSDGLGAAIIDRLSRAAEGRVVVLQE